MKIILTLKLSFNRINSNEVVIVLLKMHATGKILGKICTRAPRVTFFQGKDKGAMKEREAINFLVGDKKGEHPTKVGIFKILGMKVGGYPLPPPTLPWWGTLPKSTQTL